MATISKTARERKFQAMLAGWQTQPKSSRITAGGQQLTVAQIIARIQAMLALFQALRDAANQLHQAARNLRDHALGFGVFYQALVAYLKNEYGVGGAQLVNFGVVVKERRKPSPKTKVIAGVKSVATRAKHGILGKRQRANASAAKGITVQVLGPDGKPMKGPGGKSGQGNGQ